MIELDFNKFSKIEIKEKMVNIIFEELSKTIYKKDYLFFLKELEKKKYKKPKEKKIKKLRVEMWRDKELFFKKLEVLYLFEKEFLDRMRRILYNPKDSAYRFSMEKLCEILLFFKYETKLIIKKKVL